MFDAVVELAKPDTRLRPGMTGSIRVPLEKLSRTLLVPSRALMQPGGSPYVFVATRRGFEKRQVTVARRNADQAAVSDGLREGERVALEDPEKPKGTR
jgi:cobalt-zinc-cadmium efflux system membrane fusion protein